MEAATASWTVTDAMALRRRSEELEACVLEELRDLGRQLLTHGVPYAKAYSEWISGHRSRPPHKPVNLHVDLAACLRDIAKDQAIAVGCQGVRTR